MMLNSSQVVIGKIPDSVRAEAHALGLADELCLFSVHSDIDLDGNPRDVWLVVTKTSVMTLAPGHAKEQALTGPFTFTEIEKVRTFHTIGSVFLQCMVGGLYVDLVRYSNARREEFDRARVQIERLKSGEPFQQEAMTRPSERVCPTCGMPLPSRGATCPKCEGGHGMLLRTLTLMTPYWSLIIVLLALMLVSVALSMVPPYLTRLLVDRVLNAPKGQALLRDEAVRWLLWFVIGLISLHAIQGVLSVCIALVGAGVGTRITREMRNMLQAKLLKLDVDYYDRNSVGSLMSRVLYDTDYFQSFVDQVAGGFLRNILTVAAILIVMFTMNWYLALLVLLPIPLVIVGSAVFWKYVYPRYFPVWDSRSKAGHLISGVLSGIRLVKAFAQEDRELERFKASSEYMQDSQRHLIYSFAVFNPIMGFVFGLGGLIIWYAGGKQVLENAQNPSAGITLGTLMAFFSYVGMFYGPVNALTQFSNWLTGFVSAGQRMFEVLDADVSLREDPNPVRMPKIKGQIEFKNVTFGYDPHNPVIKNVNMSIKPGQFIGVVGKSGSGKTTLVNLVCRFYDVQQGQVLIDGEDVRKISTDDLHQQVALVLQEPFLFRASVRDNIAYGKHTATPVEVIDVAKAANAHDFIARMPNSYDRKLGERGAGLSGGERQRVTIARALIREPRILILDEATSSVDTESEQEIQKALAVLGKGRTTIVVAHRLSTLKNADHIYVMDDGKIIEDGSHEELMALGGTYHKLVRIQTELTRLEL